MLITDVERFSRQFYRPVQTFLGLRSGFSPLGVPGFAQATLLRDQCLELVR